MGYQANRNHRLRSARRLALLCGGAVGLLAVGCASDGIEVSSTDAPPRAMRAFEAYDAGDRFISEMLSVRADNERSGDGPVLLSRQSLGSGIGLDDRVSGDPRLMERNPGELMRVKYAANKASAEDVIRVLVGEYLGRDYIIEQGINDQITMDIDSEMTAGDVQDLLGALCLLHGWAINDNGGVLVVRKTTDMARESNAPLLRARTLLDTDGVAMRVRRMRYLAPADGKPLLEPVMSTGSQQIAAGRSVVLIDTVRQLNRATDVLAAVDVPEFDGTEILTYRLSDRPAKEAATLLQSLVEGAGLRARNQSLAAFIAVEGSNRLIVIARDGSVLPKIEALIRQVDTPRSSAARYRFAYRVQHYPTAELQAMIGKFFETRIARGPEEQQIDSDKMQLVWDTAGELLLVHATLDDYQDLLEVLRVVDRPRQQVTIEAVIAEVTLNDTLRYGVEYFLEETFDGLGTLELGGSPGLLADPSGSAFLVGTSGVAIVQALQSESTVNIVSQPKFTVMNGSQAEFQVGGSVPIVQADIDSNTQVGGDTAIRRNISYEPTGVILTLTPRVNESGVVELTIEQEITDVGASNDLGPTFTTRKLKTTAMVPHGRTIVLGGFIESRTNDSVSKIPFLGDLPVIGPAFQSVDRVEDRTEIILTLTPRVMSDPAAATQTVDSFLEAAWAVREALVSRQDELPVGMLRRASEDEVVSDREIRTAVPRIFINGEDAEAAAPEDPQGEAVPADDAPQGDEAKPVELPPILRQMLESIEQQQRDAAGPQSSRGLGHAAWRAFAELLASAPRREG
jgi:general secretion pathway protein D